MTLTVPLVLLLGIITVLLHRAGDMRARSGVILVLFGFYLAKTRADTPIDDVMNRVLHGLFGL